MFVYSVVMLCTEGNWTRGRGKSRQTNAQVQQLTKENAQTRSEVIEHPGTQQTGLFLCTLRFTHLYRNKTSFTITQSPPNACFICSTHACSHRNRAVMQEELLQRTLPLLGIGMSPLNAHCRGHSDSQRTSSRRESSSWFNSPRSFQQYLPPHSSTITFSTRSNVVVLF